MPPKKVVIIRKKSFEKPTKKVIKKVVTQPKKATKATKSRKPKKEETPYEKCRKATINRYLKLYERGILKIRGNPVKSRGQAIAVALQLADKSCASKMTSVDMKDIITKVEKLYDADIKSLKLRYSDITRIAKLKAYYRKPGVAATRLRKFCREYLAIHQATLSPIYLKTLGPSPSSKVKKA